MSGMLFNLYINDLPECLKYLKTSMYAYDAKLFATCSNESEKLMIQEDLDRLHEWCCKWRLRLNAQKCFYLQYKPTNSQQDFSNFEINGVPLTKKDSTSYLGIVVSANLKCHEQVALVCKKANREINIIRRSLKSRNHTFLSNMYKMHVRPHLEYCVQVWNPVYSGDGNLME